MLKDCPCCYGSLLRGVLQSFITPAADWRALVRYIEECEQDSAAKRPRAGPHPADAPTPSIPTSDQHPAAGGAMPPASGAGSFSAAPSTTPFVGSAAPGESSPPVRTEIRIFDEIVRQGRAANADRERRPYRNIGASTYNEFRKKAEAEAENHGDSGLPVNAEDIDVEYHDEALDDGARWTGLQVGRTPGSRLIIIDFTYEAWGRLQQGDSRLPQNRVGSTSQEDLGEDQQVPHNRSLSHGMYPWQLPCM